MRFDLPRQRLAAGLVVAGLFMATLSAQATPLLVMDSSNGAVLYQQDATKPWYPASLTKLVTVYVALKAVKEGRIAFDTPMVVSARAARMPPSKMGFKPGTEITLDNALKMLMVKSANDLAIVIAEAVDGSVEDFAVEMNRVAASLGMRQSHFVNPNGLHDPNHYSSARDMALVAQALYRDFPQHDDLYGIGALRLGTQIIPTHNGLMGRYPGIEGMKTGFTCPAGFNVVASATRGGRRLIAVVLGYPSAKSRTLKAASLLDIGFASRSNGPQAASLADIGGAPPNMRGEICTAHRKEPAEDDYAVPVAANGQTSGFSDQESTAAFFANDGHAARTTLSSGVAAIQSQMATRPTFEPISVYVGRAPGYTGPVLGAREIGGPSVGKAVSAAIAARTKATARAERAEKAQAKATAKHEAKSTKAAAKPARAKVKARARKPAKAKAQAHAPAKAQAAAKAKAAAKSRPVKTAGQKSR